MMNKTLTSLATAALLALALVGPTQADRSYAVAPNAKHQQECASCHLAYPPGLLSAASWTRIMGGLNKHYGTDASLDEATTQEILVWLKSRAEKYSREEPAQDRISKTRWFVHEHDEVSAATWKSAKVGSPANCGACHTDAVKGDFNEHAIRIPR